MHRFAEAGQVVVAVAVITGGGDEWCRKGRFLFWRRRALERWDVLS